MSYDREIIYCIYLSDKAKVIWIKDFRIFRNVDEKKNSQIHSFDTLTSLKYQPNNHIPKIKSSLNYISTPIIVPTTILLASILLLPHTT